MDNMNKKIVMTKDDYGEFMELRGMANSYQALNITLQLMDAKGDLTLDNLVDLLTGISDEIYDQMNYLIEKHGLNGKSLDDIVVLDTVE